MSFDNTQALLFNNLLALSLNKIIVPSDFHGRVLAVKEMLDDDISGLVDSLTDFAVDSASVNYNIETNNDELTKIFKLWSGTINKDYRGKIPSGINALAKEYYKELWKGSSFPVLRIAKWDADPKSKLILPTRLAFLDGGSIYAHDKRPNESKITLDQYDYYLGKSYGEGINPSSELNPLAPMRVNKDIVSSATGKNKLDANVIFSRPYGRWFDKYPNPYLIKRGIYHNWRIIVGVKRNQIDVLDQVIPYLLIIKKGTERLAIDKKINYNDEKLKLVIEQIDELIAKAKTSQLNLDGTSSTPVRASQFDEELKHLIPDLEALFKKVLTEGAEKNILGGLGFIDVVESATSTRRESNLNPKPFIQNVETGINGFTQIIKDLLLLVIEKNKNHPRYMGASIEVTNSPVKGFMTDKFKERVRQLWDRGLLSSKTCVEMGVEIDFEIEVQRREKEAQTGIDLVCYPHLTENREDKGFDVDFPGNEDDEIPDGKKDKVEKKNFNKASLNDPLEDEMELIGSPYSSVKDLPKSITDRIKGIDKRRAWLSIFNSAYNYYKGKFGDIKRAESLAFATANKKYKEVKTKKLK